MRKLCLNICSTCQIFTNFKEAIRPGINDDILRPFTKKYKKLISKNGTGLTDKEVRENFDVRVVHAVTSRTEWNAILFESALQQLVIGIAGKGVNGRHIRMPDGCPKVKLSVVNTSPRGVGNPNENHLNPVFNVYIGAATEVIDNDELKNSDKWGNLISEGPRVFKFKKPSPDTVTEVRDCVIATRNACLDKCRDRD